MLTPEMVHYNRAEEVIAARRLVLQEAYRKHPERFVRRPPAPLQLSAAVWINPPAKAVETTAARPSGQIAQETSRLDELQPIFLTAPDALDGPNAGEIQPGATLNSIVKLSQTC
jgi:hypothetical protein